MALAILQGGKASTALHVSICRGTKREVPSTRVRGKARTCLLTPQHLQAPGNDKGGAFHQHTFLTGLASSAPGSHAAAGRPCLANGHRNVAPIEGFGLWASAGNLPLVLHKVRPSKPSTPNSIKSSSKALSTGEPGGEKVTSGQTFGMRNTNTPSLSHPLSQSVSSCLCSAACLTGSQFVQGTWSLFQ